MTNEATVAKANHLFAELAELTTSPSEALMIIEMLHVKLWINFKSANADIETMLAAYCEAIRINTNIQPVETIQ